MHQPLQGPPRPHVDANQQPSSQRQAVATHGPPIHPSSRSHRPSPTFPNTPRLPACLPTSTSTHLHNERTGKDRKIKKPCPKPTNENGSSPFPSLWPLLPSAAADTQDRQNNALLDDLASKVTALRGVTVDIYDQARDHTVLDHSVRPPPPPLHPFRAAPLRC